MQGGMMARQYGPHLEKSAFDAAMAPAQESGLRENCTSRLR
jgi:hypothetical protein